MTYHLWFNGNDTGPYTHDEVHEKLRRGELIGVLWRRTGDTNYQPHTDLEEELNPTPKESPRAALSSAGFSATPDALERSAVAHENDPNGRSGFGMFIIALGGVLLAFGCMAAIVSEAPIGKTLIGASFSCFVLGVLLQINAKLILIAHRLRK